MTISAHQLPLEIAPASGYTQRWRDRRHSWRHTSEGGFDPQRYIVAEIPGDTEAREFILQHHYSGAYPAALRRYGLYESDSGALVGVAVLGSPANAKTLTNVFPGLLPYTESMELSRFVLLDRAEANSESWFLARVFRLAYAAGVRGIVSFSDPVARTDLGGHLIFPGHYGTIYQATNAIFTGRGKARTLTLLPDGRVFSDRAAQKVRAQEKGAAACERLLIELGATPRRTSEDPTTWLNTAFTQARTRKMKHPGNLRYLFPLGRDREERQSIVIGVNQQPYPKKDNHD